MSKLPKKTKVTIVTPENRYAVTADWGGIGSRGKPIASVSFRRDGKQIGSGTFGVDGNHITGGSSVDPRIRELATHWLEVAAREHLSAVHQTLDDGLQSVEIRTTPPSTHATRENNPGPNSESGLPGRLKF